VADKAMSTFCPLCHKRLVLENYRIDSYAAVREFATCGDVVVEKRGTVAARVQAENLLIKGRLMGDIRARGKVEIAKSGDVHGDIHASRLVVQSGAKLRGFCQIGPALPESGG